MTDGDGNVLHASRLMPTGTPVQYEYSIPQSFYATGSMRLRFVHDNPTTSIRGALPEIWIFEDIPELTPPKFESVEFNDVDGDAALSIGDEFHFHFSEAMDTSLAQNDTTDANDKLVTDSAAIYGTLNQLRWLANEKTLVVTLTDGFTVTGSELVTPTGLTDKFSNNVVGSQPLTMIDTVKAVFTALEWIDVDNSTNLTLGDQYRFVFNEAMDIAALQDNSTDANAKLRPEGGLRYGTTNTIEWENDQRAVLVTVTDGYNIIGDELVVPSGFVTDVAGNRSTGSHALLGKDTSAPELINILFDDADGNNAVSIGDRYIFVFNEPMKTSALSDGTAEANINLAVAGGGIYGTSNAIVWSDNNTRVAVRITEGFTITGGETVTPSDQLTDINSNSAIGSAVLTLQDTVSPEVLLARGSASSPVPITDNYQIITQFSSSMYTSVEPVITITGSTGPSPVISGAGSWSSTVYPNDTYTTPSIVLTPDMKGNLAVNILSAQDTADNVIPISNGVYTFVVQSSAPTITNYPLAPVTTSITTQTVTIEGERDDNTAIWVDDQQVVASGSGAWSANIVLQEGQNDLSISATDADGNRSASASVSFLVDSTAPSVSGITPQDSSSANSSVDKIIVSFVETGSGIDIANSSFEVKRNGNNFLGNWVLNGSNLEFVPSGSITEGNYQVNITLKDLIGLSSSVFTAGFTIDQTPPAAPVVDNLPAVTTVTPIAITGNKELGDAILLNGQEVVANSDSTTWSYSSLLFEGDNELPFTAKDRAGNESQPTIVNIRFDNTAPGEVLPTVDGSGDGTTAQIDWSTYDEVSNGNDIKHYLVYISANDFTNVNNATAIATVPAGTQSYQAQGLINGQTYYFAVLAVDTADNAVTAVSAVMTTVSDNLAPSDATNVEVESFDDHLIVSWAASTSPDVANYRLEANGIVTDLASTDNQFDITGLSASTAYPINLKAIDVQGNVSEGVSITGVTLLDNPTIQTIEALSGQIQISWNQIEPADYVSQYGIYASTSDFSTIEALSPILVVPAGSLSAGITGLDNNTTYYVAVTTLNTSKGQRKVVTTMSATPTPDTTAPEFTDVRYGTEAFVDGFIASIDEQVCATVTDLSTISRVEFYIDGTPLGTDSNEANGYCQSLALLSFTDGEHTIELRAYDIFENEALKSITFNIQLAPPAIPVITSPGDGHITNQAFTQITGTSEAGLEIQLQMNDQELEWTQVNATGVFIIDLPALVEGNNEIKVRARNRSGEGAYSAITNITLDTSLPPQPIGLRAESLDSGRVRLEWSVNTVAVSQYAGFNIYRSTDEFTDKASAIKVNNQLITDAAFENVLAEDGTYYYRVSSENDLGTESELSDIVSVVADSQGPIAESITYTTDGAFDVSSQTYGRGELTILLTIDEPLLTTPFLSISPDGGVPINVPLDKVLGQASQYTGTITLDETTQSGVAYAVFSARDTYGNRGTDVLEGSQINIDTAGPRVINIATLPETPIKNDAANPVTIDVLFELDESLPAGEMPSFRYNLSSSQTSYTELTGIESLGNNQWQGQVILPTSAGLSQPESLGFAFTATDALGNEGDRIDGGYVTQIYQGELPPLSAPFNFRGHALSAGRVQLDWFEVESASGYQLYRKAPGEAELTAYLRIETGESYIDQTSVDGDYEYQIASIRQDNGQESLSAKSELVTVTTDSQAPDAPANLALELFPIGIQTTWDAVSGNDVRYRLYRADSGPILSTEGLTPVLDNLVEAFVVDTNASEQFPAYVVVAVDGVGNESEPSNTAYLNVDLLPVSSMKVRVDNTDKPLLEWNHSKPSINLFDVYLGADETGIKLNETELTQKSYTDVGYANNERQYAVVAIDGNAQRSLARTIKLPRVDISVLPNQTVKRNLINEINVSVTNFSKTDVANTRIKIISQQGVFQSRKITLPAEQNITVPITVAGLETLPDNWQSSLEMHSEPNAGEIIEIAKSVQINVQDGALGLSMETTDFVRGADGTLKFQLENSGEEPIQLITARSFGKRDAPGIVFTLVDADNNTLAVSPFRQVLGEGIVNAPSGEAIKTIAAGERWLSDEVMISIPNNAPDEVFLITQINNLYANRGTAEEVRVKGPTARQRIVLTQTAYKGTVTNISPESSFGDQPIVITGQAIDNQTNAPVANVDLNIIISVSGYERSFEVVTDESGNYELTYEPQAGESGRYKISPLHPILTSRPVAAEFVINRLSISPSRLSLNIPYLFDYNLPLSFRAGDGTELTNLRFELRPEDQPNGSVPSDINFTFPEITQMTSGQKVSGNITIRAEEAAVDSGQFFVSVFSDESPTKPIGTIDVIYQLQEATPALFYSPGVVELGATLDSSASSTITLENRGLVTLQDVNLSLKTEDGFPAFDWIRLVTPESVGDIEVGETKTVDILLQPNNAAPVGTERFLLEVNSSNAPTRLIPVYTAVSESGEGGVLLKVTDMYSGTLDDLGRIIQGLQGAQIRMQNEALPTLQYNFTTDNLGEVFIEDIPAGRYSIWVTAANYQEEHLRVRIQPGLVKSEQVFMDYNLIRLEWSVKEITIQDRYEIVLKATFQTDVPAAVVMLEPTSIELPKMEEGDVFYGELQMTNYGLIRAFDINFTPQQSDEFFQFDYLVDVIPEALEAKEVVIIPYKVTALKSLEQQDATGGGCGVYTKCAGTTAKSNCPTGVSETETRSCVTRGYGTCATGSGGSSLPSRPSYLGGGGGGGGGFGGFGGPLPVGSGMPECRDGGTSCGRND